MDIQLDTLRLTRYSENEHYFLKEEFEKGESASKYIHQIGDRLEMSKDVNKRIYQTAFVVVDDDTPVGYLYISSMVNDEVFLEYAILKEFRGKGYASDVVYEVSDYLFQNCNIKCIKLDIDPSNEHSILVANSCGFIADEEEFVSRNLIGKIRFVLESDCYVSKRASNNFRL